MSDAREVFRELIERDRALVEKIYGKGLRVPRQMSSLSREMAESYDVLFDAGLYEQAETVRKLSSFWIRRYERATRRKENINP